MSAPASLPAITWSAFGVICIAASRLGALAQRIGLPAITGFLVAGTISGPFALQLIRFEDFVILSPVSQIALAFICFAAGAELYLPELRPLFKRIASISVCIMAFIFLGCFSIFYAASTPGTGLLPAELEALPATCRLSLASAFAVVMASLSPASSIAVVKETRAKGIFVSSLLGVTVLCDVVVLFVYTFARVLSGTACSADVNAAFNSATLAVSFSMIAVSVLAGCVVGSALIFLLQRTPSTPAAEPSVVLVIVSIGWACFEAAHALLHTSKEGAYIVELDPLLVCITAGAVASNYSGRHARFLHLLSLGAPWVLLPFFVLTGIALDLETLIATAGAAFIFALVRATLIVVGTAAGCVVTSAPREHTAFLGFAFITQAGVSLGLAAELARSFPSWGPVLQSAIIGVVLINQIAGPILCKLAIEKSGDAGKARHVGSGDGSSLTPPRGVFIVGSTPVALATASRLLRSGCDVTLIAHNDEAAVAATLAVGSEVGEREEEEEGSHPPLPPEGRFVALPLEARGAGGGRGMPHLSDALLYGPSFARVGAGGITTTAALLETAPLLARLSALLERAQHPWGRSASDDAVAAHKRLHAGAAWVFAALGLQSPYATRPATPIEAIFIALPSDAAAFGVAELFRAILITTPPCTLVTTPLRIVVHVRTLAWAALLRSLLGEASSSAPAVATAATPPQVLPIIEVQATPTLVSALLLNTGVGAAAAYSGEGGGAEGSDGGALSELPPATLAATVLSMRAAMGGGGEGAAGGVEGGGGGHNPVVFLTPLAQRGAGARSEWRTKQ